MRFLRLLRAYWEKRKGAARQERRGTPRNRTRLRPGKLLDRDLRFLADCAILDRTARGLRIRCFGDTTAVEDCSAIFDEKDGTVKSGRMVWLRRGEAGFRLDAAPPSPPDPMLLRKLASPYYAVTD